MHETVEKLLQIENCKIEKRGIKANIQPTIIAVTKTFKITKFYH